MLNKLLIHICMCSKVINMYLWNHLHAQNTVTSCFKTFILSTYFSPKH